MFYHSRYFYNPLASPEAFSHIPFCSMLVSILFYLTLITAFISGFERKLYGATIRAATQSIQFGIKLKKYAINWLNPQGIPQTAWIMRGIHNRHKQTQKDVWGQHHYVRYMPKMYGHTFECSTSNSACIRLIESQHGVQLINKPCLWKIFGAEIMYYSQAPSTSGTKMPSYLKALLKQDGKENQKSVLSEERI